MIAATNPFLSLGSPVMPIGTAASDDVPLLRVETNAGRVQCVPAEISAEGLRVVCGGTSWLRAHFPNTVEWRGFGPGPQQPPFCAFRAARALREACAHVEARRSGKLGSAAA